MVHAGVHHLANERSGLARARAHDSVRRETSLAHDVQFQRRCNFDAAPGCSQSGAQLWNRVRFYRVEHLRALRKQLEERLSLTLSLVEVVDVKRRAVSLQEFAAETTCDHGPPLNASRRAFPERIAGLRRDPLFPDWRSHGMPPPGRTSEAPCDEAFQRESVRSAHLMRAGLGPR